MKYKKVKFPINTIKGTQKALAECKAVHDTENATITELPSYDEALTTGGTTGVAKMQEMFKACEERKRQATEKATATIKALKQEYIESITKQLTIDGTELADNPDYMLIRDGLVLSSAELETIASRNEDNIAILNAVEKYATEKDWKGFDYSIYNGELKKVYQGYGDNFFDGAIHGATDTNGYQGMRILEPNEPSRLAKEFGILEEFNNATK